MPQLRKYQEELVQSVSDAWKGGFKAPCIVLGCGGGKSCIVAEIARRTTWRGKRVLFLVHRRELVEQIARTFLMWGVDMHYCDIMMVQTATRRIRKLKKPSLIITDENHHSPAKSYKNIYEAFFDVYRVGVTATPTRLNGDGLCDTNDKLIIGPETKWLIDNHYLAPYDYYAPKVADLTGLHIKMGEYVTTDIEKAMIKKAVFGDVIKYYKQLANGKKAVCYCASVKHSVAQAEAFRAAGIPAAHIDGETPAGERANIINAFRLGSIKILCNVDLISEGFDVPDCECSILLRPTQSLTLYIQQSMRCMRYRDGKQAVIIDHVGNYARFGMPDDHREWTLEKRDRKQKKKQENTVRVCTCPDCFYTFLPPESGRITCPRCGYMFAKKDRELDVQENTELTKIEGFRLHYDDWRDCQTYSDLIDYGKRHGYKPGWAYYKAKQRGLIA